MADAGLELAEVDVIAALVTGTPAAAAHVSLATYRAR
jgi:hypothetical protein